jgi:hypothetical protein
MRLLEHSDSKPVAVSSARAQLSSLAGAAVPPVASGMLAAAKLVDVAARRRNGASHPAGRVDGWAIADGR